MRIISIISLIALVLICGDVSSKTIPKKSPNIKWQPVFGLIDKETSVYFDADNKILDYEGKLKVGTGVLLFVPTEGVALTDGDKKIDGKSMIEFVKMECKTGFTMVAATYVFDVKMPTHADTPIASAGVSEDGGFITEKQSPLYLLMCPDYI